MKKVHELVMFLTLRLLGGFLLLYVDRVYELLMNREALMSNKNPGCFSQFLG